MWMYLWIALWVTIVFSYMKTSVVLYIYSGGQNNGNTEKLRNIICLCWLHWKNFSWQHWMFFFHLFTFCNALVSELVIVLSDSPCERIGKLQTCLILKGERCWCMFSWSIYDKTAMLLGISRATTSKAVYIYIYICIYGSELILSCPQGGKWKWLRDNDGIKEKQLQ
jgi:hypothetical protein